MEITLEESKLGLSKKFSNFIQHMSQSNIFISQWTEMSTSSRCWPSVISLKQSCNEDSSKILGEGSVKNLLQRVRASWNWIHDFVATFG